VFNETEATGYVIDADPVSAPPATQMVTVSTKDGDNPWPIHWTKIYANLSDTDGLALDVPYYVTGPDGKAFFNVTTTSTRPRSFSVYFRAQFNFTILYSVTMHNGELPAQASNVNLWDYSWTVPIVAAAVCIAAALFYMRGRRSAPALPPEDVEEHEPDASEGKSKEPASAK